MQTILKVLACLSMITLVLCDKSSTDDCNDIACTLQFAYLTVKVIDSQSQPVALESYKVILTEDGSDITPENLYDDLIANRDDGIYVVFSDNYADEYQNKTVTIRFTGFIDAEQVVSEEFTVGADCCHVKMITNSNVININ